MGADRDGAEFALFTVANILLSYIEVDASNKWKQGREMDFCGSRKEQERQERMVPVGDNMPDTNAKLGSLSVTDFGV